MVSVSRRSSLMAVGGVGLAAAAAGAAFALRVQSGSPSAELTPLLNTPFPDADGSQRRLADWRQPVRVVNFWATWCPPCVEEMPLLQRIHTTYSARGVVVIGVGIDSSERIRAFRDKFAIEFPLLVAGSGGSDLGRGLGNANGVLPFTALLAADGNILHRRIGLLDAPSLQNWINAAVADTRQ